MLKEKWYIEWRKNVRQIEKTRTLKPLIILNMIGGITMGGATFLPWLHINFVSLELIVDGWGKLRGLPDVLNLTTPNGSIAPTLASVIIFLGLTNFMLVSKFVSNLIAALSSVALIFGIWKVQNFDKLLGYDIPLFSFLNFVVGFGNYLYIGGATLGLLASLCASLYLLFIS
jgi:hypothetical protein